MNASEIPADTGPQSADAGSHEEARQTVEDIGSAVASGSKGGLIAKITLARSALRLIRRYPVPALIVAGVAVTLFLATRPSRPRLH